MCFLQGDGLCDQAEVSVEGSFNGNRDQGSAYRFLRDENNNTAQLEDGPWFFEEKLLASDGYKYDRFGKDVSNTDLYCLVGAPDANVETDALDVCPAEANDAEESSIDSDSDEFSVEHGCRPKDQGKAYLYEKEDEPFIITGFNGGNLETHLIDNTLNAIIVEGAPPRKKIQFFYGFKKGNFTLKGGKCVGTTIDIRPKGALGNIRADADGNINSTIFIPASGGLSADIHTGRRV